jgi:hypothetical protein
MFCEVPVICGNFSDITVRRVGCCRRLCSGVSNVKLVLRIANICPQQILSETPPRLLNGKNIIQKSATENCCPVAWVQTSVQRVGFLRGYSQFLQLNNGTIPWTGSLWLPSAFFVSLFTKDSNPYNQFSYKRKEDLVQRECSRVVFRRFPFRVSARTSAILTGVFHAFPHFLRRNARTEPQRGYNHRLKNPFHFTTLPSYYQSIQQGA